MSERVIVFGGGCFWCTEAVFQMLKGVVSVEPGYAGASPPAGGEAPTYEQVSTGKTGYAEAVRVTYDADAVSFNNLLTVFFATHDPTQKDGQGPDIGPQYRSAIFYTEPQQRKAAEDFIKHLNRESDRGKPIVTEVKSLDAFYPAEDYHRNYYAKNPQQSYCQAVINPKLKKVQEKFSELLQ